MMFSRSLPSKVLRPLQGRYTVIPYDIFRVQPGPRVALRDFQVQKRLGRRAYDLHVGPGGMVQPSVGDKIQGPNGCSVRPMGLNLDEIVDNFPGSNILIYRLREGIQLPKDLVLLHEHTDHHSLQCAVPMTLESLNKKLTDLFATQAECMNRDGYSRDMARCSPLQQQTRVCMRTVRLQQRRRKTEGIFIT